MYGRVPTHSSLLKLGICALAEEVKLARPRNAKAADLQGDLVSCRGLTCLLLFAFMVWPLCVSCLSMGSADEELRATRHELLGESRDRIDAFTQT